MYRHLWNLTLLCYSDDPARNRPSNGTGMERTAAQWGRAPQVGNATQGAKRAQWKQELKLHNHRQQTYLYLGLPYTEDTRQST